MDEHVKVLTEAVPVVETKVEEPEQQPAAAAWNDGDVAGDLPADAAEPATESKVMKRMKAMEECQRYVHFFVADVQDPNAVSGVLKPPHGCSCILSLRLF